MIGSVLVANRGEIAVRVVRAVQEIGVRAIAVYSEADRGAPHTRLADDAVLIGPAPARESYLSIERILDAARATGADAIHPGYGFLSENPLFAEACTDAGLIFIGPPASAMRLLGDKMQAKRAMQAAGVPVLPGYHDDDQRDEALLEAAERIGYPLLVKASAGGGGRGMRRVDSSADLPEALASARREALSAFGDDRLLLERLLEGARHIEVQVVCDQHGNVRHLGERECSVQRRHQKVIEEAPSPVVDGALRARLGATAEQAMRVAGYVGAGTVEMLLGSDGSFYFMEVNARLQVEHPVTELAWGLDLVKLQLAIANGEPLGDLPEAPMAHAIECRIYAEDPSRGYQPSTGVLSAFNPPLGPNLRHDVGVETGSVVTPYYDAMLGKMIAWGNSRRDALASARWGLTHYRISGVTTNLRQLQFVLDDSEFSERGATIDFLDSHWDEDAQSNIPTEAFVAAAAAELSHQLTAAMDPWSGSLGWRLGGQDLRFEYAGQDGLVRISARKSGKGWLLTAEDDREWSFTLESSSELSVSPAVAGDQRSDAITAGISELTLRSSSAAPISVTVTSGPDSAFVQLPTGDHTIRRSTSPSAVPPASAGQRTDGAGTVEAPMPGRLVRIQVKDGETVRERQPLVIMEAMKIEHTVSAPRDGVVKRVHRQAGDQVERGTILVELEET